MTTDKTSVLIRFRASERDRKRLAKLARHYDRSASSVLRRLIGEAYARMASDAPKGP